jgi:glycerophosphoryl diester phosphodiesterase
VPRVHVFFEGLKAPLHVSHRGGAKLAPENTMLAFRAAVTQHRTDMLELDVHATRDGEVVVFHDATLERCTDGAGPIAERSWAELQQLDAAHHFDQGRLRGQGVRIPRLVQVLDAFPSVRINLEVKTQAALGAFVALMKARPAELRRLCIGSEHDDVAAQLHAALPDALHFFPANALAAFVMSARTDELVDDARYTVLDMPLEWEGVTVFDAELARIAKARGKFINVWTIDDPAVMRQLVADGVGGVMTDRPDLLRDVLG